MLISWLEENVIFLYREIICICIVTAVFVFGKMLAVSKKKGMTLKEILFRLADGVMYYGTIFVSGMIINFLVNLELYNYKIVLAITAVCSICWSGALFFIERKNEINKKICENSLHADR